MSDPIVPSARGYLLTAFRTAAADVFGAEGAAALAMIAIPTPPPKWIPEADLIAGAHALWEGPARRERARYNAFIQRQVELGSGRVQRMLLSLASPRRVIDRAPAIWSSEHTHGELTVDQLGERSAILRLGEHPYVETPQARATIAEVFRHIVSLTRAGEVSESHALERGVLVVRLSWS